MCEFLGLPILSVGDKDNDFGSVLASMLFELLPGCVETVECNSLTFGNLFCIHDFLHQFNFILVVTKSDWDCYFVSKIKRTSLEYLVVD